MLEVWMPTAEERRRQRLLELINLEGGLDPADHGSKPGHYRIAQRVIDYESKGKAQGDPKMMAQSLRQVARGKMNLGPKSVARIEAAYAVSRTFAVGPGWFDDPTILIPPPASVAPAQDDVMAAFVKMFTAFRDMPPHIRAHMVDEISAIVERWKQAVTGHAPPPAQGSSVPAKSKAGSNYQLPDPSRASKSKKAPVKRPSRKKRDT